MASPLPDSEPAWRDEPPAGAWWSRVTRGFRKLRCRRDWDQALGAAWPERIFDIAATDNLSAKQGRSVGRLILGCGDAALRVYLKRHYRLSRWAGLLATFFPRGAWSPGWQEARNLQKAAAMGVPVPRIVAAGEVVRPAGRLLSFLAVEELRDMLPLHEAVPLAANLLDPRLFATWKRGLATEMARLTRLLHDRRHFHKDLYLCHYYVARRDCALAPHWPGRLHMIDFHRLAHHPWTWPWWRVKDLGQLLFSSWIEGVTPRDRLRFWRAYIAPSRKRRLLAWLVGLRGGLYRRQNDKRNRLAPPLPADNPPLQGRLAREAANENDLAA